MRYKESPQLPGAGRTREWHHHGSHTPTSPGSILLGIQLCHSKHFYRQYIFFLNCKNDMAQQNSNLTPPNLHSFIKNLGRIAQSTLCHVSASIESILWQYFGLCFLLLVCTQSPAMYRQAHFTITAYILKHKWFQSCLLYQYFYWQYILEESSSRQNHTSENFV